MKAWPSTYIPPIDVYGRDNSQPVPSLRLHNSLTGLNSEILEDRVTMYVCGITPYDATHLGHAATYLTFDLIKRFLQFRGQTVTYVQNITDVDDPLLERAQRDGIAWQDLAESQIALFRDDMTALKVLPPDHYMGAVETIPWVIDAINSLKERGAVYQLEGDLYFDVNKDPNFDSYNALSNEQRLAIFGERGGDPARLGKRNPLDCLIWKGHREGEPSWESPFGSGRPGWHIECTAIALHFLSAPISIQGGGSDLHFPHHSMCAAEGRVLSEKNFARRFVHTGMIGLDGEKMSKSRGNLKFVSEMRNQGIDPNVLRVALLTGHYREDRSWSQELLESSIKRISLWRNAISSPYGGDVSVLIESCIQRLSDDLDTPGVFALLDEWAENRVASMANVSVDDVSQIGKLSRFLDAVLGVTL